MTFVVPFDGSPLAQAALSRAVAFAGVADESVVVVTVVPDGNASYAHGKGWLSTDEPFDGETIAGRLRARVADIAPDAGYRVEFVGKHAPSGTLSTKIRRVLKEADATMVFVGSDNAGRVAASVASVGQGVSRTSDYDAVIIRTPGPSAVAAIRDQEPLARQGVDPDGRPGEYDGQHRGGGG
jgi:nucleotide-binding universal stress UspA family protein